MQTSLNTKENLWYDLIKEEYPEMTADGAAITSLQAAGDWYNRKRTKLSFLYERYMMLKELSGIE